MLSRAILDSIRSVVGAARHITVCGHVRPDGDAAGSVLALSLLLARLDDARREVRAAVDVSELGLSRFLYEDWPEAECALLEPAKAAAAPCDLLVCLDAASVDRLPKPLRPLAGTIPVLVIDHHVTNPRFGTVNWVADASSTGEMVALLARRMRWAMDRRVAEALWVAILTDSCRFSIDQTTPATLRIAAFLLSFGVRTAELNDRLYVQCDRGVMELRLRAYRSLEVSGDGRYASVAVTLRDFEETGCRKADAEDIVDIPRMPRGNRVAVFFYENPESPGLTCLSIRTRPPFDATEIALRYGGGGHPRAAGCSVSAPLKKARAAIGREIREWISAQEPLS
ncbi:MAG: DHH family phosphoesterase [Kiritimatiellia bacterium]|jgi:phosphoesterase RecJ-like protein